MAGEIQPYRPITTADKVSAIDSLVDAVAPVFQDLGDRVADYPSFIASDQPRTLLGAATRSVARANCRIWAASDKSGYGTRQNARNAELCGPYLDSIGERPDDGAIGPEFTGGQCNAVYLITLQRTNDDGTPSPAPFVRRTVGPILGTRRVAISSTPPFNYSLQVGSSGEIASTNNCGAQANTGPGWRAIGSGIGQNLRLLSVQACGADNCGNPPPAIRPPAIVKPVTPQPPTFPITLPGVGVTNVNISLNVDGDPVICIPALGECRTVPVEPPQPEAPGGSGGPAPGDDGQPGTGQTAGGGQDAQGEAPPGSVLVGLRMNMTTIPPRANQIYPGAYRGAAYIYMGGGGGLDQDFAGSILANGQFVYAEKDNLTKWKVRANNDFVFNVVPYYRSVT